MTGLKLFRINMLPGKPVSFGVEPSEGEMV